MGEKKKKLGLSKKSATQPDLSEFFGTSKGEQTKSKIVSACLQVLGEVGYGQLTFESVGQKIGLMRAQVAYHFPDKDELVARTIAVVFAKGGKVIEDKLNNAVVDPQAHLKAYIEGNIEYIYDHTYHTASITTLALHLATLHDRYRLLAEEVKMAGLRKVERILSGMFAQSGFSKPKIDELAWIIHTMLVGEFIYLATTKSKEDAAQATESVLKRVKRILENA